MGKNDRIMAKSYFDVLGEINFDAKKEEIDITSAIIGIDKTLEVSIQSFGSCIGFHRQEIIDDLTDVFIQLESDIFHFIDTGIDKILK